MKKIMLYEVVSSITFHLVRRMLDSLPQFTPVFGLRFAIIYTKIIVLGILQQSDAAMGKIPRSRSRVLGQLLEKVRPNIQERERSKSAGQTDKPMSTPAKPQPKKSFLAR